MIRVILPHHLRTLARVADEVQLVEQVFVERHHASPGTSLAGADRSQLLPSGARDGTQGTSAFAFLEKPFLVPDLRFTDDTGRSRTLAEFRGRGIVLNIWATWCIPCRKEMPTLDHLQAMLGMYPYAPLHALLLDPHLPEWLPEITVHKLRIGPAQISIRFFRTASGTSDYELLDKRGTLHVIRQPSPWSLTADWGERVRDAIESLLPHRVG